MDNTNNFSIVYDNLLNKIESRLAAVVPAKNPTSLYEPINYLLAGGGKRLRPVLTMIFCGAVGGNPDIALDSGVALEILHNFTLVHDDIMDESPLRRGRQTVHVKWNQAVGILSGDAMIGHAYALLPLSKNFNRADEVLLSFTKGLIEVCEGQALDMDFNTLKNVSMAQYIEMIGLKTSALFCACAKIGANIGMGTEAEIEALKNYAYLLGIAFQIQDDLLDLTAEQLKLGKTIGQDIIEGKKTFLIIKALEKATGSDFELLQKYLDNNGLSEEYIPVFQEMFTRLGVIEDAENEIDRLTYEAKQCLNQLKTNEYINMLVWLVEKLNKRKY